MHHSLVLRAPIIVEWERDARHSAGLSLVRFRSDQTSKLGPKLKSHVELRSELRVEPGSGLREEPGLGLRVEPRSGLRDRDRD
ncbi:hypothetical protein EVAR_27436_1 [Eumeta japonica]|uniref:Uncharacterized protein n=1 Tax=Eumeta variegata TaxID=151549 RepID=A0A4C1VIZ4_EUMVA|nr:hypothetical protein EVAR_27436_1 [Eumeta japonica]